MLHIYHVLINDHVYTIKPLLRLSWKHDKRRFEIPASGVLFAYTSKMVHF